MLPFALKVTWFVLSLTGLLSSLVGMPCFVSVMDGLWMPITYGMANVTIQSVFCLGMIWKMNPLLMPPAFCIAQATLAAFSWFVMTSSCATISIATSTAILRAHSGARTLSVTEIQGTLKWRPTLMLLIIGFPLGAFTAFLVVALKLHAVSRSDGMICDVTDPIWVRLLSFAGVPLLLAVPSLLLSCTSVFCLLSSRLRSHDRSPTSRVETFDIDIFTPVPGRRESRVKRHSLQHIDSLATDSAMAMELKALPSLNSQPIPDTNRRTPSTTPPYSVTLHALPSPPHSISVGTALLPTGRAPITSTAASTYGKRYHLPFSWRPASSRSSPESDRSRQDQFSRITQSPSPMMFAPPSTVPSARTSPTGIPVFPHFVARAASAPPFGADEIETLRVEMPGISTGYEDIDFDSLSGSLRWARRSDVSCGSKSEMEFVRGEAGEENEHEVYTMHSVPDSMWEPSTADSPAAHSSPTVWRILFFQLLLSSTQILAAISSLVDMLSGHDIPTPFGTQHVALVIAAWAPTIAFGVLPWRRKAR